MPFFSLQCLSFFPWLFILALLLSSNPAHQYSSIQLDLNRHHSYRNHFHFSLFIIPHLSFRFLSSSVSLYPEMVLPSHSFSSYHYIKLPLNHLHPFDRLHAFRSQLQAQQLQFFSRQLSSQFFFLLPLFHLLHSLFHPQNLLIIMRKHLKFKPFFSYWVVISLQLLQVLAL